MKKVLAKSCRTISSWLILTVLLLCALPAYAEAVKILPMGDSLTNGYRQYVSYRYDLWFDLVEAGFDVDFVGGSISTEGSPNMDWYPEYLTTFDRDHQGHSGYTSDQLEQIAGVVATMQQPDIVLLWIGVNDIWGQGEGGVMNAKFGIRGIIEDLRSAVPDVIILLGLISPYDHVNSEYVEPLNREIAALALQMNTVESPIILVDLYTGFDVPGMTWDNVHQNRAGETWIAEKWFQTLATLLPEFETDGYPINVGHSGAWYDAGTSGQGQLIDVEPESQFMFLAWFTFTAAASSNPDEQHWYTAQGNYGVDEAELTLYETLGGEFDSPQATNTNEVGKVTVSFNDCETGQMEYSIDTDGRSGVIPLQRVIPGSHNVCETKSGQALDAVEAVDINAGMDGAWVNIDTLGQGFLIDAHTQEDGSNFIFVAWFTYGEDTASGQHWFTAQGDFAGTTAEIDLFETTGGRFHDPQLPATTKVGTMSIDFTDCSNAQLSYSLAADEIAGDMAISRLIPGGQTLCEELTAMDQNR